MYRFARPRAVMKPPPRRFGSHPASFPVEHSTVPAVPPPAAWPHLVGQSLGSVVCHVPTEMLMRSEVEGDRRSFRVMVRVIVRVMVRVSVRLKG